MVRESQLRASKKYNEKNCRVITMKLSKIYDKDVLDRLDSVDNRQGYVKALVRKDLASKSIMTNDEIKSLSVIHGQDEID